MLCNRSFCHKDSIEHRLGGYLITATLALLVGLEMEGVSLGAILFLVILITVGVWLLVRPDDYRRMVLRVARPIESASVFGRVYRLASDTRFWRTYKILTQATGVAAILGALLFTYMMLS